jgi:hypothetical protein
MDDFSISSLHESKNEWASRLITILTPLIVDGYRSILDEALKLCRENNETEKYLMTFQNFISRIPKWNQTIIETEKTRICEKSGCSYLEDLVTCVHIIQLKILTAMRVGQKQKKIDINIPKLDDFIHKTYINVARKIYKNVYLFELNISPLQIQKHNRELEIIVQEGILNTLRESIPVDAILKAYMDETIEENVTEEIKEQYVDEPIKVDTTSNTTVTAPLLNNNVDNNVDNVDNNLNRNLNNQKTKLSFSNNDFVRDEFNNEQVVNASKDIDRLEQIGIERARQRKLDESDDDDDDDNVKLKISDQNVELNSLDIHQISEPNINLLPDLLIDDIEILT